MKSVSDLPEMSGEPIYNSSVKPLCPNFMHNIPFSEPLNESSSIAVSDGLSFKIFSSCPNHLHFWLHQSDWSKFNSLVLSVPSSRKTSTTKRLDECCSIIIFLFHMETPDFKNEICLTIYCESLHRWFRF